MLYSLCLDVEEDIIKNASMKYHTSQVSKKLDIPENTVRYWSKEYSIGTGEKRGKLTVRIFNEDDIEKFEKVKRLRKENWSKQDILDQISLGEAKQVTEKVQKGYREGTKKVQEESRVVKELKERIKSLEKDKDKMYEVVKTQQEGQKDIKELVKNQQIITTRLQEVINKLLLPEQATVITPEPTKPRQSKPQRREKKRRVTKRKKVARKQDKKPQNKRKQAKKKETPKNKQNFLERIVEWFSAP